MQKPDIWRLVMAEMAPTKVDASYNDWRAYVNRYLLPELRQESMRYYGSLDCIESQNPGLDYAAPAHRLRLSAFVHHNQLFVIMDRLRLTPAEIHMLCKWYGTKRAKEDLERKNRIKIVDTTWADIKNYEMPLPTVTRCGLPSSKTAECSNKTRAVDHDMNDLGDEKVRRIMHSIDTQQKEESEDELQQSIGLELNQRLISSSVSNTEALARGENVLIDAAFEQWLKEAAERNATTEMPQRINLLNSTSQA